MIGDDPHAKRNTGPDRLAPLCGLLVGGWLMLMWPLAHWGLPSTQNDEFLFGGAPAWPAERYEVEAALAERSTRTSGADTDLNPIESRDGFTELTATPARRAEILRRYRLFSRQPDEMITFMALQRMNPGAGDLDPQLYQYGGAYIYGIGAAIGALSAVGWLTVADVSTYLEQPELFARFYLVGRGISLLFGALALLAAYTIGRQLRNPVAGLIALVLVAATPVFLTGALEAKPHLPSVSMLLCATSLAIAYLERPSRRKLVGIGVTSGLAMGLVLTGLAAVGTWLGLLVAARIRQAPGEPAQGATGATATAGPPTRSAINVRTLVLPLLIALTIYALTNPYVIYNSLFRPAALSGNLGNSWAMYADQLRQLPDGCLRVGTLLVESVGGVTLLLGGLGLLRLAFAERRRVAIAFGGPLLMLALCCALAAGKPAEFARFLLLPAILLAITAGVQLGALFDRLPILAAPLLFIAIAQSNVKGYVDAFRIDVGAEKESRRLAAIVLAPVPSGSAIGVLQEPAPYSVPPLDFARRTVVLLPDAEPSGLDPSTLPEWLVYTADDADTHPDAWWRSYYNEAIGTARTQNVARIPWANKPVFLLRRADAGIDAR